jgi:outer membrane lipoprotein SlyB
VEVNVYTGYGLVLGAALGLLLGTLFSEGSWIAPSLGAVLGLIVGSIVDARRTKGDDRT